MDKVYLGRSLSDFYPGIASQPVTRVELLDESGNITGQAGTTAGKTLTALQPDGTDEMAQYILSQVSGYTHKGYEGSNALLNPAAELGDGVTVDGYYLPLIQQDSIFDSLSSSGISAPDADEIEDEYPYKTQSERQTERKFAQTRSMITKTAEQIRLEVSNEISGLSSSIDIKLDSITSTVQGQGGQISQITQRVDGISSTVQSQGGQISQINQSVSSINTKIQAQDGRLSTVEQTASGLTTTVQSQGGQISQINQSVSSISSRVSSVEGSYSSIKQTVNSITLSVSNGTSSSDISLYRDGIEIASKTIRFTGDVVFESDLSSGRTSISGDCIDTGQISARYIKLGGRMRVYESVSSDESVGYLGYMNIESTDGGFSGDALGIYGDTHAMIYAQRGNLVCGSYGNVFIGSEAGYVKLSGGDLKWNGRSLVTVLNDIITRINAIASPKIDKIT